MARQARRQVDRLAPEVGAQLSGDACEEGVEILDQVEHVVGFEIADRRRMCLGAKFSQALADRRTVRADELGLLVIEVEQEGVAQDLHDVGLRQQPHAHREFRRAVAEAETKARDETGRLAIARRIDLAQEVVGLVGEARLQGTAVAAREDRDEIGLAGLAGAEHAHAHAAPRGARQLAALVTDLLQLAHQRRGLLRHGRRLLRRVAQPRYALARGDGQRLAILGQLEIDCVHDSSEGPLAGLEHAGVEPVALTARQCLKAESQAIERDGATVAIGHLTQTETFDVA